MKNNSKIIIWSLALLYNISIFAFPGQDDNNGSLSNDDPPAPIDNYIYIMVLIGLVYIAYIFKERRKHVIK